MNGAMEQENADEERCNGGKDRERQKMEGKRRDIQKTKKADRRACSFLKSVDVAQRHKDFFFLANGGRRGNGKARKRGKSRMKNCGALTP